MPSAALPPTQIIVLGAGIIGLSIAFELRLQGADVTIIDRGKAISQASWAAAGMLAAHDPHNPPALQELASLSAQLYDKYLRQIREFSELEVPYQTQSTFQYAADGSRSELNERSLDPRQLASALLAAAKNAGVVLREQTILGETNASSLLIHTTGAWGNRFGVRPRKGQMLRIRLSSPESLSKVHRAEHIYVVPRTQGPQAGTALIGATVEDTGFDVTTQAEPLAALRDAAADLHPDLVMLRELSQVEAWAGLRPSTSDDLPIIGRINDHELVATGHFRNGILLAPVTAQIIADVAAKRKPEVNLAPFAVDRSPA